MSNLRESGGDNRHTAFSRAAPAWMSCARRNVCGREVAAREIYDGLGSARWCMDSHYVIWSDRIFITRREKARTQGPDRLRCFR